MDITIAFLSGLVAAFTPCVIVLMPILLYRFFNSEKKQWRLFVLFVSGFIVFYTILSFFLSEIFSSQIQNGFKIGLGILFVSLGILSFLGKLNPLNVPIVKNPLLLGATFALIAASNPCSLPYLSLILADADSSLAGIISFGLGVILPSILFALLGQKVVDIGKKSAKFLHSIHKLMAVVLVLSGMYLAYSINEIKEYDVYVAALMLTLTFIIIMRSFFMVNDFKDIIRPHNLLLILGLLLIIAAAIYHCGGISSASSASCHLDVESCEICKRCLWIFGLAAILGFIAVIVSEKFRK